MKRLWHGERASVSIFLIIVLAALFLFHAVLIEFARIHAAKLQMEQAVRAGARSAMAAFDPALHAYGLFGLQVDGHAEQMVENMIARNLHADPHAFSFVALKYQTSSARVNDVQHLSELDVFQQQILEEMKYRAPAALIMEVSDKFRKTHLQHEMAAAARSARLQHRMRELFDQREHALDQVWSKLESMIGPSGLIEKLHERYSDRLAEIYELADEIGLRTADELRQHLFDLERRRDQLREWLAHAEDVQTIAQIQSQMRQLASERSNLQRQLQKIAEYHALIGAAQINIHRDLQQLNSKQSDLLQVLDDAEELNRQLHHLTAQYSGQQEEQMADELVLGSEYFHSIESKLAVIVSLFQGFAAAFDPMQLMTGYDFLQIYSDLQQSINALRRSGAEWHADAFEAERRRQARNRSIDQDEAAHEQEMKTVLNRLKDIVYDCPESYDDDYARLAQLEQKYEHLNELSSLSSEHEVDLLDAEDDPIQWQHRAADLLERFESIFYGIRNEWFIYEYALTYFNHRAYRNMSDRYDYKPSEAGMTDPARHALRDHEAEYLLYGFHSCAANQSAAFAELFALRLGIRLMEEMTSPEKTAARSAVPWVSLLWAAADASKQAFQDVQRLLQGEETVVSAKLPASMTLNYKDYLRLFMILHARKDPMLIRLQSLLELNTGIGLDARAAAIEVEGAATLPAWFLPLPARAENDRQWKQITIQRRVFYYY